MDDDVYIFDDWQSDSERLEWIAEHDVRFVELEDGKCVVWWDGEDYIESAQHETWRDAIDASMAGAKNE